MKSVGIYDLTIIYYKINTHARLLFYFIVAYFLYLKQTE